MKKMRRENMRGYAATEYNLTQGPIKHHLRSIAIPASVGMIFNTLYNVVDTFYAGKISTEALAGMTISFPIFFIVIALSSGIGSGTTALAAIALGKKDVELFHRLAYNAIGAGGVISLIVIIASPWLTPWLFSISGASGQEMVLGVAYTKTIFYGAVFFIINSIFNGILNAQGDTKTYRNFLMVGFVLNLLLDPLFIFGWFGLPRLGTVGVALATVIIQGLGTLYLGWRLLKSPLFDWEQFSSSRYSLSVIGDILKQGIPASLNMATIAIGIFVINFYVMRYAPGPETIGAYGVAMRIEQIALLPTLGLNIAVLTIVGQNYGAKLGARIYEVQKWSLIIGISIMIVGALIIYPFAPVFIRFFKNDSAVILAGTTYLRIEALAFPTYTILNILLATMQGVKKPNFAVYIGLYRQIVMPIVLFPLLASYMSWEIMGVWWGIVLINWSAVIVVFVANKVTLKKQLKG